MTRSISVRVGVVATLLLALVAVGGQPTGAASTAMQASDQLVVGSKHDSFGTGSDEPAPTTLTNLTRSGSGTSAQVVLPRPVRQIDSFEDSDLAEWSGNTSYWSTSTSWATDGTVSANGARSGDGAIITRADAVTSQGHTYAADIKLGTDGTTDAGGYLVGVQADGGTSSISGYQVTVDPQNDVLNLFRWENGAQARIGAGSYNFVRGEEYNTTLEWKRDGTLVATAYHSGTQVAQATATDTSYSSGGVGLRVYAGSINIDNLRVLDSTPASALYVGAQHDVSSADQAGINLDSVSNVSVEFVAEYKTDSGTWAEGASSTVTSSGISTLSLSATASAWRIRANVTTTGPDPKFAIGDESILFTNHQPSASNIQPGDDGQLSERDSTFSADISDPEFGTAQGDSVQATLYIAGEQEYQTTVTSNQTVSTTHTFEIGGTYDYYWELEDSYGATVTTDTMSVSSPSKLRIYEEQDASTQVTDDGNATVTIYATDEVYERDVDNGTVDLLNLPIDEPLYVRANIPGYYSRTVLLESLYQQQRMYVLNESANVTENRFTLEETPGYPQDDTILRIQRPLSLNNSTTWETIVGSEFGVNGFTVNLQEDVRYRLQIVGPDGTVASLGGYTATVSESVPLAPTQPSIAANPEDAPVLYDAQRQNKSLVLGYDDNNGTTSSVKVYIHERGNESHLLEPNTTYTNTQEIAYAISLSDTAANKSWVVEYHVEYSDGDTAVYQAIAGSGGTITVPLELGGMWQQIIVSGMIVLFAAAFSVYNRSEGALAVAFTGGLLLYIGWLEGITTWSAVSVAIGIGVYSMLNNRT